MASRDAGARVPLLGGSLRSPVSVLSVRGSTVRRSAPVAFAVAGVLTAALALTGCSGSTLTGPAAGATGTGTAPEDPTLLGQFAVPAPGPLDKALLRPDILISAPTALPAGVVRRLKAVDGVAGAQLISLASVNLDGSVLTVAAVDPGAFRRFTPVQTAQAGFVWDRLAGGEITVDHDVSKRFVVDDTVTLGNTTAAPVVHVGAYAPLVPRIQAVVNTRRGDQLGIPAHNALLLSTGELTPSQVAPRLRRILGDHGNLQILAQEFDVDAVQTAVLTGGSVAEAVGSFSYRNLPGGRIQPDARWVAAYIRTEAVPILGNVTCNRALFPQLRAALGEVVQRGLADRIHPGEYAGCYYPRYIGRDPSNGLSLHSWGIALDLNVPGNQRGTVGEMDRQVVAIFKKWGFAWGGDWHYTDPMHFEMNRLVRAG